MIARIQEKVTSAMDFSRLTNNIYYLVHEAKRDRPVLGYVRGTHFGLAIDAGASPAHVQLFYAALSNAGLRSPEYTAITHWHWDHTFGMCAIVGKAIAHMNTGARLESMAKWLWTEDAIQQRRKMGEDISEGDVCMNAEYPDLQDIVIVVPHILFSDQIVLDLGGVHCHISKIPSPHSDDTVAIWVPEEKVLFLGDATSPDYYNGGACDRGELNAMIAWLNECGFEQCVLGHCEPLTKTELMDYLQTL